ncbi:MAG: amidophosphoribosyltransferase [Methylophaga sp.]|nr:MAG: amidophosphoribosyltransferase [Methylophaga sp.]
MCQACSAQLPIIKHACPRCASPLSQTMLCGSCLNKPPEQDASFSLFRYQPPIDRLILDLKYHDKLVLSRLFATHMVEQLKNRVLPQLLIPIPLHPRRLRERGYNQSLELAKQLSKQLAIPVRHDILMRIRDTPPQASLPFTERKKNMKQAFQLNKTKFPDHIALIDDVLTTGHTVNVAAKTLRQAGVENIEVWTIARTVKHDHSH